MELRELRKIIESELRGNVGFEEKEVTIGIARESIGPTAPVGVRDCGVGIDWDSYQFLIIPNTPLIGKTENDSEYENLKSAIMEYLWDRKDKKPTYQTKRFLNRLSEKPDWFGASND